MSVVDSSGWIEFLLDGPNADAFESQLQAVDLVVPTIVVVEVRRWLLSRGRAGQTSVVGDVMSRGLSMPLDRAIARSAAELGIRHRLPLADSIVYATAQSFGIEVWTQDKDFEGVPGVRYIPKS